MKRSDIVELAKSYQGTKFVHQGRLPGVALDCAGVVASICAHFYDEFEDFTQYARDPDPKSMMGNLDRVLDRCPNPWIGDVMLFWLVRPDKPQHVGVIVEPGKMLHAYRNAGSTVIEPITKWWSDRFHTGYRFRGLEESE